MTAALKRSVGRANDLLAYAEAILQTWIEHGQNADVRPQREGYRPAAKAPKSSRETVPRSGRQQRDFEAEARAGAALHRLNVARQLGLSHVPVQVFLEKPGEVMTNESYSKPVPLEPHLGQWVNQNRQQLKSFWS